MSATAHTQTNARRQAQMTERIQDWLLTQLSEWLIIERDEINIQESFASYSLSSVAAISLIGELEEWLGLDLEPTLAYDYPTIESLARYISEQAITERDAG